MVIVYAAGIAISSIIFPKLFENSKVSEDALFPMVVLWPFVVALLIVGFVSAFFGELARLFSGDDE